MLPEGAKARLKRKGGGESMGRDAWRNIQWSECDAWDTLCKSWTNGIFACGGGEVKGF